MCRSGEPSARRAAHPEPQRELGEGGGQARPWRLAALALLVLAAAPPATRSDVPGSTQPTPRLSRALGELGVGAEVFAALPAATRDLCGLPVGINAAAGAYIHALQLERANSSLASLMEMLAFPTSAAARAVRVLGAVHGRRRGARRAVVMARLGPREIATHSRALLAARALVGAGALQRFCTWLWKGWNEPCGD